jgi:peptidoglycan hydrolase CwlO-like protein
MSKQTIQKLEEKITELKQELNQVKTTFETKMR